VNPWTTLVLLLSWLLLYLLLLLLFAADLSSLLLPAAAIIVAAAAATIALISTTHRAKQIINHGMRAIMMVPMPFPRGRREGSRERHAHALLHYTRQGQHRIARHTRPWNHRT
jgi:hypothetical protein